MPVKVNGQPLIGHGEQDVFPIFNFHLQFYSTPIYVHKNALNRQETEQVQIFALDKRKCVVVAIYGYMRYNSPPSWKKLEFCRKVGSNLDFLHRDGAVVGFNIDIVAISNAICKASLRRRERELRKQKESHTLILDSMTDALLYYLFEEENYREAVEQRIELDRIDQELQAIKQIKRYKDKAESARIRDLLLAQQRGASRSTAMRYATDLSLVTMPTPPTEETALGSLNCGRTYHVAV